jgi:hypothetical protein
MRGAHAHGFVWARHDGYDGGARRLALQIAHLQVCAGLQAWAELQTSHYRMPAEEEYLLPMVEDEHIAATEEMAAIGSVLEVLLVVDSSAVELRLVLCRLDFAVLRLPLEWSGRQEDDARKGLRSGTDCSFVN